MSTPTVFKITEQHVPTGEERITADLFVPKWKGRETEYTVHWCYLCDCAIIACSACSGSTCNCHQCDKCKDDQTEFNTYKTNVQDYLTDEECKVYEKCLQIKKFILETVSKGEKQIDFKRLKILGEMSNRDEQIFQKELT